MSDAGNRFAVLLFTDIVGSTAIKNRYGVPAYSEALRIHNGHFERLARDCRNIHILRNMGDGYFAEAGGVVDAVRFALLFQHAMREGPWGKVQLTTRVGIHAGEISEVDSEGGCGIVAPAADLAARVMSLAVGGQILLTRMLFDEGRHFMREHPEVSGKPAPPLGWLAHGPYLFQGRDEPVDVFEVGAEGLAPLSPPADGDKAKRAIRPGEEETLGWRPAVGLEIPDRPGWKLIKLLGAGGFGEVWAGGNRKLHQRRAFKFCFDNERLRALKREVTLVRLIRSALGERDDIVKIHEIKLDAPPFYLESDLAPHGNLIQWADNLGGLGQIPLPQRILLVAHTATALAAAHSIGVLHKDIKPTNVLIFDGPRGEPLPRLVDFGIGTLAEPAVLDKFGVTSAGFTRGTIEHSTGTPTYSPPEYLAGRPYTIQGDIYGLGVLLYQVITAKPFDPLATGWERDVADPLLREDIAACVDGDPSRRLPSAADLAERLLTLDQRHRQIEENERLAREAAACATFEAAAKDAREHSARLRKLASVFGLLALLAIAGGALAWRSQRQAAAALAEVENKKREVDRQSTAYRAMLAEAARSDRFVAEEKLAAGLKREAMVHFARACAYDPRSHLAAEKVVVALNDWPYLLPTTILAQHTDGVTSACYSPDGKRIVTASWDESAMIWDVETGTCVATLAGHGGEVVGARFNADGTRILMASRGRTAQVWDTATGKSLVTLSAFEGGITSAEFTRDATRVATTSLDKIVRIWDAVTGKCLVTFPGHTAGVTSVQFNPAGTQIVTASEDHSARVWEAATGKCLVTLSGHKGTVHGAYFNLDGTRIVTVSEDETAKVWEAVSGRCLHTLVGHSAGLTSASFSPDGTRIVTAGDDKSAQVWDAASGQNLASLTGHADSVTSAEFSPDGSVIVTASMDRTARVWDPLTGRSLAILAGHQGGVTHASFNSDGSHIVTASWDHSARLWNLAAHPRPRTFAGHELGLTSVNFSADGKRIVTGSRDQTARIWEIATGRCLATLSGHDGTVLGVQFSPDNKRIVTASEDKTARVWDAASGQCLVTLEGHDGGVLSAQFSPDGQQVFSASYDTTTRVWDAVSGKCLAIQDGHKGSEGSMQFSADGSRLVTASADNTALVWDLASNALTCTLRGHEADILNARFNPRATRVVTASLDQSARVWDTQTGKCLVTLTGHKLFVTDAQFSPDGTRIATASEDHTERLWDAADGQLIASLTGNKTTVWNARFGPDGSHLATVSPADETAYLWDILPAAAGQPPAWFADFLRYLSQMRFTRDGDLEALAPADWLALLQQLRAVRQQNPAMDTPYLRILRRYLND